MRRVVITVGMAVVVGVAWGVVLRDSSTATFLIAVLGASCGLLAYSDTNFRWYRQGLAMLVASALSVFVRSLHH
jgi:hypothetical protein